MGENIILALLFIIVSLLVGVLLKMILRKTFIPYTVGLFVLGFVMGIIARYNIVPISVSLDDILKDVGNLSPDAILYIFLPILIFEASLNMDIHIFRKSVINASLLAVPGVIVCLILTAIMIIGLQISIPHWDIGWNWTTALMFGALISATDPVAVVALLNELKTNKRFSTLVDAESMLNDGTGIVFFMLFFTTFTSSAVEHGPIVSFIITVIGSIISGYIIGVLSLWGSSKLKSEPILQNSILIIASYILFYYTNMILEVSGVIALVTFGVVIAYYGPTTLRPKADKFIKDFWELAAYIANTIIFIIVGVMIAMKSDFVWSNFGILILVYIGITIIRGIMVFMFYPIMKRQQYGITPKEGIVLTWGGLRGALGLTLALLVFYTPTIPEAVRHQILFLTGGVVTLTLTINATTMSWVIKKLNLSKKPSAKLLLEYNIKAMYKDKIYEFFNSLRKDQSLNSADWSNLKTYLPDIGESPSNSDITLSSLVATIRRKIMARNLTKIVALYQDGVVSATTFKKISSMIEQLDDYEGEAPFTNLINIFTSASDNHHLLPHLVAVSSRFTKYYVKMKSERYDLLNGIVYIFKDASNLVQELKSAPPFNEEGIYSLSVVEEEINMINKIANEQITAFSSSYPLSYIMAINAKAKRILLHKEKSLIKEFAYSGMLSEEDEEKMLEEVGKKISKH